MAKLALLSFLVTSSCASIASECYPTEHLVCTPNSQYTWTSLYDPPYGTMVCRCYSGPIGSK